MNSAGDVINSTFAMSFDISKSKTLLGGERGAVLRGMHPWGSSHTSLQLWHGTLAGPGMAGHALTAAVNSKSVWRQCQACHSCLQQQQLLAGIAAPLPPANANHITTS